MKTAVITCLNHKNLGMYSVDLGAKAFFSSLKFDYRLFCAHNPPRPMRSFIRKLSSLDFGQYRRDRYGDLEKHRLTSFDELKEYDFVCYWGDFTTNPTYLRNSFMLCEKFSGDFSTRPQSIRRWESLFGSKAQHPFKVSIGQNFQHRDLVIPGEENERLHRNLMSMRAVLPRDLQSTSNVSEVLAGKGPVVRQFPDCAFFADTRAIATAPRQNAFGFFCGRSMARNGAGIFGQLESVLKTKGILIEGWLDTDRSHIASDFERAIRLIRSCRYIVTDTYHLAINSLREGRVVFLITEDVAHQEETLGDFKKIALFEDLGLQELLVRVPEGSSAEEIASATSQAIEHAARNGLSQIEGRIELLVRKMAQSAEWFKDYIDREINSLNCNNITSV